MEAQRESERLRGLVEKLQVEMGKQSALIKDLDDRLKRATANGPKDQDRLKSYMQSNLSLEQVGVPSPVVSCHIPAPQPLDP